MTPEAQRIAIAEACGLGVIKEANPKDPDAWKRGYFTPSAAKQRRLRWKSSAVVKVIPDYLSDLNAMHEAEKHIPFGEARLRYSALLRMIVARDLHTSTPYVESFAATAAQRAEAFLHTLNLYV